MHSTAKPAIPPERLRAVGTQLRMHAASEMNINWVGQGHVSAPGGMTSEFWSSCA